MILTDNKKGSTLTHSLYPPQTQEQEHKKSFLLHCITDLHTEYQSPQRVPPTPETYALFD